MSGFLAYRAHEAYTIMNNNLHCFLANENPIFLALCSHSPPFAILESLKRWFFYYFLLSKNDDFSEKNNEIVGEGVGKINILLIQKL